MQSFREPAKTALPELSVSLPVAVNFTISASTLPLLALLAGGRAITAGLTEIGQASEEIFRGDRLPNRPLL